MKWRFLLGMITICSGDSAAEPPDLWKSQTALDEKLEARSIGDLAIELNQRPLPGDAEAAIDAFLVYQRAGYEAKLEALFPTIGRLQADIGSHTLGGMADILIDRNAWNLARRFLESAPLAEPGWGYVMLREWKSSASPDEIDVWLKARIPGNRTFWAGERFRFAAETERLPVLIAEYQNRLRQNPADLASAMEVAQGFQVGNGGEIDWIASAFKPASASAALQVGAALRATAPEASIALLTQALRMPFTEEDQRFMKTRYAKQQRFEVEREPEKDFRAQVRYDLLQAYREAGKPDEAQKLMEEMAEQAADGYSGVPPFLAGQVQSQSGARVIEEKINKAEDKNSPEYWQKRGDYFLGRKETGKAEAAYRLGLKVASIPAGEEKRMGKGFVDGQERYRLVSSLARCLKERGELSEARDLLLDEVALWAANFQVTDNLVWNLVAEYQTPESRIDPNHAALWRYFEHRKDWSRGVERALREMGDTIGKRGTAEQQSEFWKKAEKVAEANPEHQAIVGWAMNQCGEKDQSIVLLQAAFQALPEGEKRDSAASSLYSAFRESNRWKEAEALFPAASRRFGYEERTDALASLAELAARAGAQDDALRLWKRVMDRDRTNLAELEELMQAGLKNGLEDLYQSLLKTEPDCTAAKAILTRL